MIFCAIQPEHVDDVYPVVAHWLEKVLRSSPRGDETKTILDDLRNSRQSLWVAFDKDGWYFAVLTEVVVLNATGERTCLLQGVGGSNLKAHLPMVIDTLSDFAVYNGCTSLRCSPRKGLGKWLKGVGFHYVGKTPTGDLYFKELSGWKLNSTIPVGSTIASLAS